MAARTLECPSRYVMIAYHEPTGDIRLRYAADDNCPTGCGNPEPAVLHSETGSGRPNEQRRKAKSSSEPTQGQPAVLQTLPHTAVTSANAAGVVGLRTRRGSAPSSIRPYRTDPRTRRQSCSRQGPYRSPSALAARGAAVPIGSSWINVFDESVVNGTAQR